MRRVLPAPLAELGDLQALFERLLVLAGMVIHAMALAALQFDEIILGHTGNVSSEDSLLFSGNLVQTRSAGDRPP